jgi:hypothetical protein
MINNNDSKGNLCFGRSAEPFFLVQLASTLWETKILRPILRLLTVFVSRTKGLSVKSRHVSALIHSAANAHFGPVRTSLLFL